MANVVHSRRHGVYATIDLGTPEGRQSALELSREAQLPFAIYLDGRKRKIDFDSPIERIDRDTDYVFLTSSLTFTK